MNTSQTSTQSWGPRLLLLGLMLLAGWGWSFSAHGNDVFTPDQPLQCFTNLADPLLHLTYGDELTITNIPLYPTNRYTPGVHRLLQLAANLNDACTSTVYPSVFRPVFRRDESGVSIAGYEWVTNNWKMVFDYPCVEVEELATNTALNLEQVNVYNVPWVVGAKRGFPNFNQLFLQTALTASRKLEFRRANLEDTNSPVRYLNPMYSLSISNLVGVDAWNSYNQAYANGDLVLFVTNEASVRLTVALPGFLDTAGIQANHRDWVWTNFANGTWLGWPGSQAAASIQARSFRVPLSNSVVVLPPTNMVLLESLAGFDGITTNTLRVAVGDALPIPQWTFQVQNRLRFLLVDTRAQLVVDCVNLSETKDPVDVTALLGMNAQTTTVPLSSGQMVNNADGWNTNWAVENAFLSASPPTPTIQAIPTVGIMNQVLLSARMLKPGGTWKDDPLLIQATGGSISAAQDFFSYNLFNTDVSGTILSKTNIFYTPYYPVSTVYSYTEWRANDPLVHYMVDNLTTPGRTNASVATTTLPPERCLLGMLDWKRYRPWGANDTASSYNPAYQDPLIYRSDDWQFPTNLLDDPAALGQVHRGTPWQTLYLKSAGVDLTSWTKWTGNLIDPAQTLPPNDWRIAAWLAALLSTNTTQPPVVLNPPDVAGWTTTLDGLRFLTNIVADDDLGMGDHPPYISTLISSNLPQALTIAQAIEDFRSSTNFNGSFTHFGDLLGTPALSLASPFLNLSDPQKQWGISDVAYEALPAQLLMRLRPESRGSLDLTNGLCHLRFTGQDGFFYYVENSLNLLNWTVLQTNTPVNGSFEFTEPEDPGLTPHFYRTRLMP